VEDRGLEVAADPMNDDPRFQRVRVRKHWLPALREENPRIAESLVRLADAAREQRAVLDFAADQLLGRARQAGENHAFDIEALRTAPPAVIKHAMAGAAQAAGGAPLEAVHLEAIIALLSTERGGTVSLDLPHLKAIKEYQTLRLAPRGHLVHSSDSAPPEISGEDGPYVVRRWQPGDRMRPERLKGRSRKLSDLFTDNKIPRDQRTRARVVTRQSDGEIVWAEHIGPAYGRRVAVKLVPAGAESGKN
jgi:tRNA(Ile)-lysidine synthase